MYDKIKGANVKSFRNYNIFAVRYYTIFQGFIKMVKHCHITDIDLVS